MLGLVQFYRRPTRCQIGKWRVCKFCPAGPHDWSMIRRAAAAQLQMIWGEGAVLYLVLTCDLTAWKVCDINICVEWCRPVASVYLVYQQQFAPNQCDPVRQAAGQQTPLLWHQPLYIQVRPSCLLVCPGGRGEGYTRSPLLVLVVEHCRLSNELGTRESEKMKYVFQLFVTQSWV